MGYVNNSLQTNYIFKKYSGDKSFDFYQLKIEAGDQLMHDLSLIVPIIVNANVAWLGIAIGQ